MTGKKERTVELWLASKSLLMNRGGGSEKRRKKEYEALKKAPHAVHFTPAGFVSRILYVTVL